MIFAGIDAGNCEIHSEYNESEINSNGWLCTTSEASGQSHVCPVFDFRNHTINSECWCQPFEDEGVIVHNSMDGREKLEIGDLLHH